MMLIAESEGLVGVRDLAVFLGYASAEKLYRLNRGENAKPSFDIIEDFSNKFDRYNMNWVITGKGEMLLPLVNSDAKYTLTPDAGGNKAGLSDPESAYILSPKTHEKLTPTLTATHKKDIEKQVLVPQYITVDKQGIENILWVNVRASAGYVKGHADREYLETLPSFNLPQLRGKGTYRTFEVDGDSMFPTLENKEAVVGRWVEKIDDIVEDYVHIIVSKTLGVLIKRVLNRVNEYGYLVLKSDAVDNRNQYPNLEVYPEDILEIWMPVMHLNKKFRHPTDMYKRINNLEADLTEVMRLLKGNKILPDTSKL